MGLGLLQDTLTETTVKQKGQPRGILRIFQEQLGAVIPDGSLEQQVSLVTNGPSGLDPSNGLPAVVQVAEVLRLLGKRLPNGTVREIWQLGH
jgi:hypothetical protein